MEDSSGRKLHPMNTGAPRTIQGRAFQLLLIVSTLALSWLGMMVVHEFGHVSNSTASRTDAGLISNQRATSRIDELFARTLRARVAVGTPS